MTQYCDTTREALIDAMLRELEERGEPLPESRPAEDQPER